MDLNTPSIPSPKTGSTASEYDEVTPLEWAEYEFATIEYDYRIPERAANAIRAIFKRLSEGRP